MWLCNDLRVPSFFGLTEAQLRNSRMCFLVPEWFLPSIHMSLKYAIWRALLFINACWWSQKKIKQVSIWKIRASAERPARINHDLSLGPAEKHMKCLGLRVICSVSVLSWVCLVLSKALLLSPVECWTSMLPQVWWLVRFFPEPIWKSYQTWLAYWRSGHHGVL